MLKCPDCKTELERVSIGTETNAMGKQIEMEHFYKCPHCKNQYEPEAVEEG